MSASNPGAHEADDSGGPASEQIVEVRRRAARHRWRGPVWLTVYLSLITAPIFAVVVTRPDGGVELWWDLAMNLGLAGLSVMMIQFALTARIRRATSPFGADLVYVFHRYLAWLGFGLIVSHFLILYIGYEDALGSLDPRIAAWELTVARLALVAFGLAVVTAEFRKTLGLEYGLWRYLHVALAVGGTGLALAHVVGTGRLSQTPASLVVWAIVTVAWLAVVVWLRLVKPFQLGRRPYIVVAVRPERGDAWTLVLEPDGWSGITGFSPGQFAWISLSGSPFALQDHPFSISSAPSGLPRIEMTIKALGDFSNTIRDVPIGQRAWIDGPFGVFSHDRYPEAPGLVFVAGGIGITPVMSMLRDLADQADLRPLWLFYANADWESVTFREEIEALGERLDLTLIHVVEDPPKDFTGVSGRLEASALAQHLPAAKMHAFRYFLCGPVPLTEMVDDELRLQDVPAAHIRTELFELA